MTRTTAARLGVVIGLLTGLVWSWAPRAFADRNASGTYSLPTGQPVVAGTTITASIHNALASDLGANITDSLSRSGEGAMLAPLQCTSGTVSLPSLTFSGDTNTGLYRDAADNPAMSAGGVMAMEWTTGTTYVYGHGVAGHAMNTYGSQAGAGLTATSDGGDALQATATGWQRVGVVGRGGPQGYGGYFQGADDGGYGLFAAGVGQFHAIVATGGAGAYGVSATGGAGAPGVRAIGGSGNTNGIEAVGVGSGGGVSGAATTGLGTWGDATSGVGAKGTATTGTAIQGVATGIGTGGLFSSSAGFAVKVDTGGLKLLAAAAPDGAAGNLSPSNIIRSWATINTAGASEPTIAGSYNLNTATDDTAKVRVTFGTAMPNANYAVAFGVDGAVGAAYLPYVVARNAAYVDVGFFELVPTGPTIAAVNPDFTTLQFSVTITGAVD